MAQTTQPVDRKLVQLFDLSLDALCIAGFDGYLRFANPAFARLLGYTQEELLARPFMDNVHPADVESARTVLGDLAAGNNTVGFECRQVCADGTVRWFEWNTSTRAEEGLVYGVARDVTDRHAETEQLSALRRVATLVAEGTPPAKVFSCLAEEVKGILGAQTSAIARLEADGTVRIVASVGPQTLAVGARFDPRPSSVLTAVIRTGRPARKADYKNATTGIPEVIRRLGLRSTVATPIMVEGALWGVIAVGSARDRFPDGTEHRLAEFTKLAATAISNAQSREAIGRLAEEQAALRRVATLVAQGAPPADVFAAVSAEVDRVFGLDAATSDVAIVGRFEDGPELVVVGISKGVEVVPLGSRWPPDELFAPTHVLRTGRSARVRADDLEAAGGEVADFLRHHGYQSQVASPIVVDGRLWGAMSVNSRNELPPDTEERLERFTELVATAIANAESREAVAQLAEEQAALRRVATLVAGGAQPDEVFWAVSDEVGGLFGTEFAAVGRFEPDPANMSRFFSSGALDLVGADRTHERWEVADFLASAEVLRTGRSARTDAARWESQEGETAERLRSLGIVSTVASPIVVEGELWGAMLVASTDAPVPVDTEERLEKFTKLVATAIANAEARQARAVLTEEQAALRRVATLVAEAVPASELFGAVALEVSTLFGAAFAGLARFEGESVLVVGESVPGTYPAGARLNDSAPSASAEVLRTGRSARFDAVDWSEVRGPIGAVGRRLGVVSTVASPILVEGRTWGAVSISSTDEALPHDAEVRLEKFSDLVATAIANAESKSELTASRRRIVSAADEARRRIERDLHDGIQQRLIALALRARAMTREPADELPGIAAELSEGLKDVSDELREVSRGIHPTILTEAGLGPALRALARRSDVPIDVDVRLDERLPAPVEAAAYYVASEALTNVAKHAHANVVELTAARENGVLALEVRDDGIGGVEAGRGSGILGLTDRVEALGGSISIATPPHGGTTLSIRLPLATP